ncbi:TrmH family RNA methyltransferase [Capnocytophaga leadbetteri]|uniref:TrmH family RNA methyltransferase n=1 Tax=Capnocytophaga leadbetteri TaxID=327575 RepID=A0A2T5XSQ6_9FLAO|nr:RNA methyltransferase [Capnocytophaga leadbetteri]PTX03624.1 TrmH family RNA methyltransferase [Capnocytophaga leadbetteri]
MLSKNQVKLIQKLHQKKYRNELKIFIVEGKKSINEFLQAGYTPQLLIATEAFTASVPQHLITPVSKDELRKVSTLQNPDEGLAVFEQPKHKGILQEGVIVALDNVQDPGNLGTIIRLCDWFGVETLLCNTQTVDCYNPKVVQASMGSLTRVAVHYLDLAAFLTTTALPVYTMDLEGENLYTATFPKDCILILGNEANGISSEVRALSNEVITIPRFSQHQRTESLNVAMAGAIILSEVMGHH